MIGKRLQAACVTSVTGVLQARDESDFCLSSSHALSLWAQALSLLLWLMNIAVISIGSR
ncbi:MAG: hypothetical protein ACREX9_17435 [Gammaproteobacteria bacterium]